MRRISLKRAKAGMVTARTIYTLDGILLLSEGVVLKDEHMKKLAQYGVWDFFIEDDASQDIQIPETVRHEVLTQVKTQVREIMQKPSLQMGIDGKRVAELVDRLLQQILSHEQVLYHLVDVRSIDDYTFSHCVNVSILSMLVGIGMGLKGDRLKELGMGAIMHDVGKMFIPEEILQKPGGLTDQEFEEVKKHTVYGFEMLQQVAGFSSKVTEISIGHHERVDGSGYPKGLRGGEIPLGARIAAVADVYDALTTDRVYREKLDVHKALEYIVDKAGTQFDPVVTEVFVRHMVHYPVGTAVVLTTGAKGLVSRYNSEQPHRPVIRLLIDATGKMLTIPADLDLGKDEQIRIRCLWEI